MAEAEEKFNEKGEYVGSMTLTLPLKTPIMVHDKDPNPVTSLSLSEPTGEQMMAYQDRLNSTNNPFTAGVKLIELNAKLTEAQAKKIGLIDYQDAADFLTGFIRPGPEAGAN